MDEAIMQFSNGAFEPSLCTDRILCEFVFQEDRGLSGIKTGPLKDLVQRYL